jgi:Domain of unknown function (DUF4430)
VIVSHEHQVVEKKTLAIFAGESLMDEMRQNFIIQTAYGGGFMVSIEGVKSQWTGVSMADRKPVDWFLYVNGQEPPIGADSIFPHSGDVDIWDYHAWDPSTGRG